MRASLILVLLTLTLPAHAAVIDVAPTDDLRALLATAAKGDEFRLAAGTYTLSAKATLRVLGTAEEPVIVRSATGTRARIVRTSAGLNVIDVESSRHVTLRGLDVSGGARGINVAFSDDVTIEDCVIHDTGGSGIAVATGNGTADGNLYERIVIRGTEVHHAGGNDGFGIRLGCADRICSVTGALVALNHLHDLSASVGPGGGILLANGSDAAVIRDNIVHDTAGAGIVTSEGASGSIVERNAVWNTPERGIQATNGTTVRNNVVIGTPEGIAALPGPGAVAQLAIVNNTVVVPDTALRLVAPQAGVSVANNALYAQTAIRVAGDTTGVAFDSNIGAGTVDGGDAALASGGSVAQAFVDLTADASSLDAFPKQGSPLIGAANPALQPFDDFNGTARAGSRDAGAYVFSDGGNPGGTISPSAKVLPGGDGDGDGDGGGDSGGDASGGDVSGGDGPVGGAASTGIVPGSTGVGFVPVAAKDSGCAAALAVWPLVLVWAVWVTRPRRGKPPRSNA